MTQLALGRDRGGNAFRIANAVKPSKAPITLPQTADQRLTREEGDKLRAENRRLAETCTAYEDRMARKRRRILDLEIRLADVQSRLAALMALGLTPDPANV